MPRKRAVTVEKTPEGGGVTVTVAPETEPAAETATDEQKVADAEIKALESENPRGAHVVLWRVSKLTGHKSRIGKFAIGIVDGDWVTEQFGGGKFLGQKFRPRKGGGFEYAGSLDFDIDETLFPPKIPAWAPAAQQPPATGPVSNANGTPAGAGTTLLESQLVSLFTMQQQAFKESTEAARADRQMQNTMLQAWLERMAQGSKPSIDWGALLPTLAPLAVKMLTERRDPVEIARELTETIAKANARQPEPPSALTDALALMDRIETRVRRNGVPAADASDDSWLGFLKTATPEVIALVKETISTRADLARRGINPANGQPANGAAPGAPPGQPSLPPPAPAPTAYIPPEAIAAQAGVTPSVVSGPVTDPMRPLWAPFLEPYVGEFLEYAKKGKDPKACADLLLTRLELNDQLDAAAQLIDSSAFGEQFVKAFPAFGPYAVWLEMMLQAGREDLSQSDDEEPEGE